MNTDSLIPNVRDLQLDVINFLSKTADLFHRASVILSSDAAGKKYAEFKKEIEEAKKNVKDLELVMAIVAPMKAGKSTIINAIVGQDLLPSRASAMTTLPTEIILSNNEINPVLKINIETLSCLNNTLSTLQKKIQVDGIDQAIEKMAKYPHLVELISKIQKGFHIEIETSGLEQIKETLTDLNDIVRVCSVLDSSRNPLDQENFDIPCIHSSFWRATTTTDTNQDKLLGNLVIIDTPGPNESGDNLRLSPVVKDQLHRSSMVLIVLDFTQLNNKAAEEIKRQVQPVIKSLGGKENLYVLINKVDQRTEQDPMTPEKVNQFVIADLDLGKSNNENRVFEVAARRAFCATHFLSELQHNPNIKKEDMKTVRALAEQIFGIDWEEELEDCSLKQLQIKAQRLWKKSGFETFLENAINVLMESAAPRCIKSSLNISRNRLDELKDDAHLRSNAIAKDEGKLRSEVKALEEDLKHLEICRKRFKKVENIKNKLCKKLEISLKSLKETAKISLEDYFAKEDYERANSIKKLNIDARNFFVKPLGEFEFFPKWISNKIKSTIEFKPSGIFEFDSKLKAEEFINHAIEYAQSRAENLLDTVRDSIAREVENSRSELMIFLEKETNPIIERARTRLNQSFNIDLSLPPPVLDTSDDISASKPRIRSKTRTIDQGYETVTVRKRVWWHWLWVIPTNIPETRKLPDKKVNYYTVSLIELIDEINQSIETSINTITVGLNKYLDDDFQQRVDQFFKALDGYLSNYRHSLKQAQKDQQLAADDKKNLVNGLKLIVTEATEQIEKSNSYIQYTESLLESS